MRFFISVFSLLLFSCLISCKNNSKESAASSAETAGGAAQAPAHMEEKAKNPEEVKQELPKGMAIIKADEFEKYLTLRTNVPLIDLRTPREYEIGHINRAVNIPFDVATFEKNIKHLQGANEVAIYCLYGGASVEAAKYFEKLGTHQIIALEKGVAGWAEARKMMVSGEMDAKK